MSKLARSMMVSSLVAASVIALTTDSRADDRCRSLRDRLAIEHHRAQVWRYGWAIGFGAATVAQAIGAPQLADRAQRDVFYVGAVKAGIGTLARLVMPVRVPDPDDADTCADLDRKLKVAARNERNGFWLNHVGGFLVNLGGAAVLTHYVNWQAGAFSFALGYPVGLASTYTQPRWAWTVVRVGDAAFGVGIDASF